MSNLVLLNLEGSGAFMFDFFPREIETSSRANWEEQDVTIGTKPLTFSSLDPTRINIEEIYLDLTDRDLSITPQIKELRGLQQVVKGKGRPPALLALWGDREERVILEEFIVREEYFNRSGEPQRARLSLRLKQLQAEGEAVTVGINENVTGP